MVYSTSLNSPQAREIAGTLDMGEYLAAKWTASRHAYPRG